ncbi:beta-ketoacyl synthase, partial [Pseudomonas aeruginosa]
VIVGNSEAPILPECFEGYSAMGALATEEGQRLIEGRDDVDFRRASRPCGVYFRVTLAPYTHLLFLKEDLHALAQGGVK